jgi:hypothetical protein
MLHECLMQSKVLKAWTLVLTHKTLHQTQESSTKDLNLTKKGWGEVKSLLKGYSNGQELATHERRGGVPFIGIWKTGHWGYQSRPIRPLHHTGQTSRVSPNWFRALTKKTLSDGKFGLGSGHVRWGVGQVRWISNSNGHMVHWTYLV